MLKSSTVNSVHIAFSRGRQRKVPNGEMRHLRAAQNNAGNMRHIFGVSPNGKAWDFGSHIAGSNPATLVWQKCHVRLAYANPSTN